MAKKDRFPDFDGWTVEYDADKNELLFVKETDRAPRGKFVLWITGGRSTAPSVLYLRGKRDAYDEEAYWAPEREKASWIEKRDAMSTEIRDEEVRVAS